MPAKAQGPCLNIEKCGAVTVARFPGTLILTGGAAEETGAALHQLVDQAEQRRLLLDFANVLSVTSMMLSKLIMLEKRIRSVGGRLALCNLNPDLRQVFDVTGLPRLLNVYSGEQEALQSF